MYLWAGHFVKQKVFEKKSVYHDFSPLEKWLIMISRELKIMENNVHDNVDTWHLKF